MKLSLTAIAALSAAFFHPTVATGTRAAASNGNTKADEAKPQRDLAFGIDLSNVAAFFEDFDEATDGGIREEGREGKILGNVLAASSVARLTLWYYGDDAIPVHVLKEITGLPDTALLIRYRDDSRHAAVSVLLRLTTCRVLARPGTVTGSDRAAQHGGMSSADQALVQASGQGSDKAST